MSNQKLISGTFYPVVSQTVRMAGMRRLRSRQAAACRGATMAESSCGSTHPEAVV
jgi:hypothetical protein